MRILALLIFLCFPATSWGLCQQAGGSQCETAKDNPNITFFWRAESDDFSATNETLDYSAGDDTGVLNSAAAINTSASLGNSGSNGLDGPTSSDYIRFTTDIGSICDGGECRIGFLRRNVTTANSGEIFRIEQDATHEFYGFYYSDGDYRVYFDNAGANWATTTATTTDGSTYWIEMWMSASNNQIGVIIYTYPDLVEVDSATDGTAIADFGTPTTFDIGQVSGADDSHTDLVIVSSDAMTGLSKYATHRAYNDCSDNQ